MNQYRCETCNKPIGKVGGSNDCPIGIPSHLDEPGVWLIEPIGCASHSDFNSHAERDNLLKSLKEAYCCNCSEEIQSTCRGERCTQQEQIIEQHDMAIRQAERGNVLDEAIKQIKKKRNCRKETIKLNKDWSDLELNAKTASIFAMAADDDSIAILKELRQSKDGEP